MTLPPIQLPDQHENTPEECDTTLGQYMRAWNQLEIALSELLRKLLDTDVTSANIIIDAGIDQRTVRTIIVGLGKHRLEPKAFRALEGLCDRIKSATTHRNRIVHGTWLLNIKMGKDKLKAERAEWIRFYRPSDPEAHAKIFGKPANQKLQANHQFTLKRLLSIANDVLTLARETTAFTKGITLQPPRIPQPVF